MIKKVQMGRDIKKELTGGIILDESLTEIVLVKGRRSGKWGLPKGHVEPKESYLEGALREIREETGLDIQLLVKVLPCILTKRAKLFLFSLPKEYCKFQIEDSHEILEVIWYPINKLDSLPNQTQMLKSIRLRMDHIINKIKKNKENYRIWQPPGPETPGSAENTALILNGHLLHRLLPHSKKSLKHILGCIQREFPRLFYRPELMSSILELKQKIAIDEERMKYPSKKQDQNWQISLKKGIYVIG